MHPIPERTSLLKQLRLSGILDSLEARNREAIDPKLAFTEFLSLLIHDEVARHDHKKLAQRMRRANFCNEKTLDEFDFNRLPGLNRAAVHDLATCRFIDEKVACSSPAPVERARAIWRSPWGTPPRARAMTCCSSPRPSSWLAHRAGHEHVRTAPAVPQQGVAAHHR
jgi:hypothetical protein